MFARARVIPPGGSDMNEFAGYVLHPKDSGIFI